MCGRWCRQQESWGEVKDVAIRCNAINTGIETLGGGYKIIDRNTTIPTKSQIFHGRRWSN